MTMELPIIIAMAADGLVTNGARTSAGMVLTKFTWSWFYQSQRKVELIVSEQNGHILQTMFSSTLFSMEMIVFWFNFSEG